MASRLYEKTGSSEHHQIIIKSCTCICEFSWKDSHFMISKEGKVLAFLDTKKKKNK